MAERSGGKMKRFVMKFARDMWDGLGVAWQDWIKPLAPVVIVFGGLWWWLHA